MSPSPELVGYAGSGRELPTVIFVPVYKDAGWHIL